MGQYERLSQIRSPSSVERALPVVLEHDFTISGHVLGQPRSLPAPDRWTRRCDACRRRRDSWTIGSVNVAGGRGRLDGEDVERDAELLLANRGAQRVVVHDFGPGGVDDERARPEARQHVRVDESAVSPAPSARWMLSASARAASLRRRRRERDRRLAAAPRSSAELGGLGRRDIARSWPLNRRLHTTTGMPNAAARTMTSRAMLPGAEQAERRAVQARAPSSSPSCSTCRRAGRRRCRESGDRARAAARSRARRRQSRSCPGSWRRACRGWSPP